MNESLAQPERSGMSGMSEASAANEATRDARHDKIDIKIQI